MTYTALSGDARSHAATSGASATWQPALEGTLAADAMATVHDIARELRELAPERSSLADNPTVGSGTSGLAVFFNELGEATGDDAALDHAAVLIDHTIAYSSEVPASACLFSGTVGVAWAIDTLTGRLFLPDPEDDSDDVDQIVEEVLLGGRWPGHFDLISGLVGVGVYLLRRMPRASAQRNLHTLVHRLGEMAEPTTDGLAWRSRPAFLPRIAPIIERLERYPDGYFDLGLAHGAAGVLVFLAAATEAGERDAAPLLEAGTQWLRRQRRTDSSRGSYPLMFVPGQPEEGSRSAWCYGDTSVAVALVAAGRVLGDDSAVDEAVEIAARAAELPARTAGIVDACLCHGSAGLGHLCNRLAQATGDERLLDLAQRWLEHTLTNRREGEAVAGFPIHCLSDDDVWHYEADAGLLEGAAGVGLALLAAVATTEPTWDSLLLLGNLAPGVRS